MWKKMSLKRKRILISAALSTSVMLTILLFYFVEQFQRFPIAEEAHKGETLALTIGFGSVFLGFSAAAGALVGVFINYWLSGD